MEKKKKPNLLERFADKFTKPFAEKGVKNVKEAIENEFIQPIKENKMIPPEAIAASSILAGGVMIGGMMLLSSALSGPVVTSSMDTMSGVVHIGENATSILITYNYYYTNPPVPQVG